MNTNTETKQHTAFAKIPQPLLRWYKSQGRALPWRENQNPYYIWISEIMLQQTRVEAVKPYFSRFITMLPTVAALAAVTEEELLKLWEGLGYYSRARNLKLAAEKIMTDHNGLIPADFDILLTLPGIGRYTAGAISSIAYGKRVPAVDGNALRIIMRLLACRDDVLKEKTRRQVEAWLQEILPPDAGAFNQALMDLGASVCLPKKAAKCPACPLKQLCLAYDSNEVSQLPVKTEKKVRRIEQRTVLLIISNEKIALQQRPRTGLLAGLWELPNFTGTLSAGEISQKLSALGLRSSALIPLAPSRHVFSHIEWHITAYCAVVEPAGVAEDSAVYGNGAPVLCWSEKTALQNRYALPSAFIPYIRFFLDKSAEITAV